MRLPRDVQLNSNRRLRGYKPDALGLGWHALLIDRQIVTVLRIGLLHPFATFFLNLQLPSLPHHRPNGFILAFGYLKAVVPTLLILGVGLMTRPR